MYQLTISQYGLISDIIGVVLLFFFGLPSKIGSTDGYVLITETVSDDDKSKIEKTNRKVKVWSTVGIVLIVIGFILQFIGGFK